MDWKRGFGIGLLFVGTFMAFLGKTITGAVIGFRPENYFGLLGILIFLIGTFLIFTSKRQEFPVPNGLEDLVEVVGFETSIRNPLYSQFNEIDEVILDTNPIIEIADKYEEDNSALGRVFNDKYEVLIPEHVVNELKGLTMGKKRGGRTNFPKKIYNFVDSKLRKNKFKLDPDFRINEKQEDYLVDRWNRFASTEEGYNLVKKRGQNPRDDLINTADGKVILSAIKEAKKGKKVFVFTDDRVLKGVLGEVNKDLRKLNHPELVYGGLIDWENYYKDYKAAA